MSLLLWSTDGIPNSIKKSLHATSAPGTTRERLNEMTLLWLPTDIRRKDADKVSKHQDEMRDMPEKTTKLKAEVKDLTTAATIFQTNKCAHCSSLLDLPALHFRLSYHQRCLNDVLECIVCAVENRRALQVQREPCHPITTSSSSRLAAAAIPSRRGRDLVRYVRCDAIVRSEKCIVED